MPLGSNSWRTAVPAGRPFHRAAAARPPRRTAFTTGQRVIQRRRARSYDRSQTRQFSSGRGNRSTTQRVMIISQSVGLQAGQIVGRVIAGRIKCTFSRTGAGGAAAPLRAAAVSTRPVTRTCLPACPASITPLASCHSADRGTPRQLLRLIKRAIISRHGVVVSICSCAIRPTGRIRPWH